MRTLCILLMLLPALVFAQQTAATEPAGEYDDLAKRVEKKIFGNDKIKIDRFKILNNNGAIYMEGIADLYGSFYYAEEIARKQEGVQSVDNQVVIRVKDDPDTDIQTTLFAKIQSHMRSEPFDLVSIKVNHGFVTLYGNVHDRVLKEKAFEDAAWTRGVRGIDDKIELATLSTTDERLRLAIFQRLKIDYPHHFTGRHPDIIILVQHGRVTLVGHVTSEVEKQRILTSVRAFIGVLEVIDHLSTT